MRQQLLLLPSFVSEERPRHQSMSDSEYIKTPSLRWSSTRFSPPYHLYPPKLINSSPALIKLFEHPHPKQSKPIHILLSNARPNQTNVLLGRTLSRSVSRCDQRAPSDSQMDRSCRHGQRQSRLHRCESRLWVCHHVRVYRAADMTSKHAHADCADHGQDVRREYQQP